jgi:hypothetical protein
MRPPVVKRHTTPESRFFSAFLMQTMRVLKTVF